MVGCTGHPGCHSPVVTANFDEHVFCYLDSSELIHKNQGTQFESTLMADLFELRGVSRSHTALYHPQANDIVEWNNRVLGDSLRALLPRHGQEEWNTLLSHIMRAYQEITQSTTGKTIKRTVFDQELWLPPLTEM